MPIDPVIASASPEVPMNNAFTTLEYAAVYGKRPSTTSGLIWGYYGGRWGGFEVAAGTLTLTNAGLNHVVVLRSTGVISTTVASTNWDNTAQYARVYKITCAGGRVTAIEDHRSGSAGVHGGDPQSGSGGTEIKGLTFTSDTGSTADSDPGNGLFKWNNATQASATILYFDNQTLDAVSVATLWASFGTSGFIYLQQSDDASKWQSWKWTAAPVDGTGYRKFTVVLQASGGSIATAKTVYCEFSNSGGSVTSVNITAPAAGITASGGPITTSGSITLALADDLAAVEGLAATGIVRRTGVSTWSAGTAVSLTTEVTGVLPVANYATGTPNGSKFVRDDGSLQTPGSVTSVNITAPAAGITASGGPITGSGSITLALADDLLAVEGLAATGIVRRTAANTWSAGTAVSLTTEVTGVLPVANYATGTPDGLKFVRDDGALTNPIPPGTGWDFYGPSAPTGWLLCDGAAVSRTTYAALFAVIGVLFGAGNGTTTFNLPDMRRRVSIGAGGTQVGSVGNALADAGGAENVVLGLNQLPDHTHDGPGGSYYIDDGLTPALTAGVTVNAITALDTSSVDYLGGGSGIAVDLFQPTLVCNKIIKT